MSGAAVIEYPPLSPSVIQDAMWQMNMRASEAVDSRAYPERPGEPDCSYYLRTGLCRYGPTCRFNHPANRKLAIANARMMGEYPERVGQPECQYYLKTGACKFGATCKFHHPKDKAGIAGKVSLNILGYPLRPNEVECAYYLRTGQCKFGVTCKFHHPQPSNMIQVPMRGYTPLQTPTSLSQQSYTGGGGGGGGGGGVAGGWSRASFMPSPRWQGPSGYAAPLIMPQGMVSVQGWSTYSNQLGSVSSSENLLQTVGNSPIYGTNARHSDGADYYASERENIFPERPGQPECQFYMKTGDCKFGAVCKFHHPRERSIPPPNCALSPIGLPLRPGEPLCIFYSRYGICKFGPSCKFDHPMGVFAYNLSSLPPESPTTQHLLTTSADELVEARLGKGTRLTLAETRQMPLQSSSEDTIDNEE